MTLDLYRHYTIQQQGAIAAVELHWVLSRWRLRRFKVYLWWDNLAFMDGGGWIDA